MNVEVAKDQPRYGTLPAFYSDAEEGHVISRWRPTLKERLRIAFGADVWMCIMTFKNHLQPSVLTTSKWDFFTKIKK
jgi:hypothetical protein